MQRAILLSCVIAAQSLNFKSNESQIPAIVGPLAPWRLPRMSQKSDVTYPRKESVSLDLPPDQRWVTLITKYRTELIPYFQDWQRILNIHTEIKQNEWFNALWDHVSDEYKQEIRSITKLMNDPGVTLTGVGLFSIMYELGSPMGCSEVLAAAKDGTVLHGRNLDYREIAPTIEMTFIKDGKPLFVSPIFMGGVGVHTAIKPGVWSFGQNTRFDWEDNPISNFFRLRNGAKPYPTYVRDLLTKDIGYNEALVALQNVKLVRSSYFIVAGAGPYQGATISRMADPGFKHTSVLGAGRQWYLFQTNDDSFGLPLDVRRGFGTASMSKLTQDTVNPKNILYTMMAPPVYTNTNVILFIMSPKSGDYCSILGPVVNHDDHSITCPMTNWNVSGGAILTNNFHTK